MVGRGQACKALGHEVKGTKYPVIANSFSAVEKRQTFLLSDWARVHKKPVLSRSWAEGIPISRKHDRTADPRTREPEMQ